MEAIEKRLKTLMFRGDMSVKEFAASINMNASAMSSVLNGISKPRLDTLIKVANAYAVSLDWLCGGE